MLSGISYHIDLEMQPKKKGDNHMWRGPKRLSTFIDPRKEIYIGSNKYLTYFFINCKGQATPLMFSLVRVAIRR